MISSINKKIAVIGAGNRGMDIYGNLLKDYNEIEIVSVAEPNKTKRKKFAKEHNIPPHFQFNSWEDLLFNKKHADAVIISTGDKMHFKPLIKALDKGYKVLCEKPITDDLDELNILKNKYDKYSNKVMVSHVLRYTPFFQKIKELIDDKIVGKIRFINLIENIGFFHYAHSYVRGNWRNLEVGAPIILAKSCHDLDILYWLVSSKYESVISNSASRYFNSINKPLNSGNWCIDCDIEKTCPYSAKKIYLIDEDGWPVSTITEDLSTTGRMNALNTTNYGKCVYNSDNNQLDVQSLLLKFKNGISAQFTLLAFTEEMTRKINIYGTHGEIIGDLDQGIIEVKPFIKENYVIKIETSGGHAGGDQKLINSFVEFIKAVEYENMSNLSSALESHYTALAAEKARKEEKNIYLDKFGG